MDGWIKLHRKFLNWEWYDDFPTKCLFIHLLLRANHADNVWHGITVKRGEIITSLHSLSEETGLSVQQTRSAINRLKSTCEITCKTTNKFTTINIVNYECYQQKETDVQQAEQQAEQQSINKQSTTNKNDNNIKELNTYIHPKDEIEIQNSFPPKKQKRKKDPSLPKDPIIEHPTCLYGELENVKLSDKEYQKLTEQLGSRLSHWIDELSLYIAQKNKKYSSHYATILKWSLKERRGETKGEAYELNDSQRAMLNSYKRAD